MVKLISFMAAAVGALLAASPAGARSSQTITDWSAAEQADGDGVNCQLPITSADPAFPHACLVQIRVARGGEIRKFFVLGFYQAQGIPRVDPDLPEPLPRLYNPLPPAAPEPLAAARLKPGETFAVTCAGKPTVATFYRFQESTRRIVAFVPNGFGGRMAVSWEADGKPVGRNLCRIDAAGVTARSSAP